MDARAKIPAIPKKEKNSYGDLLISHPDGFMKKLSAEMQPWSLDTAKMLDEDDPFKFTREEFLIDEKLLGFAGHSLGHPFKPVLDRKTAIFNLHKRLHEVHFAETHPEGKESGHAFDCDRFEPALASAQQLLGFEKKEEFCFMANGLTENLGKLMDNFFRLGRKDWESGKNKLVILAGEFFSDQAAAVSVVERAIQTAVEWEFFTEDARPDPAEFIIRIPYDEKGRYETKVIVDTIRSQANQIKMICLSDVVFNTGQRLQLKEIFSQLRDEINKNQIVIGIDLAHSVGNRSIDLKSFPVMIHFAVGCGYKHLCGSAGSSFGIYVNSKIDLKKFPPLRGWKSARSEHGEVFKVINGYDKKLLFQSGAIAFRTSNPPPDALAAVQAYLTYFGAIGFDKVFNKSECLTRYLIAQLAHHLKDQIEFLTPLDPEQRGAMIVLDVKGVADVHVIEQQLKALGYEIDVRKSSIRLTAHYGYTRFQDVCRMVQQLALVIRKNLQCDIAKGCVAAMIAEREKSKIMTTSCHPERSEGSAANLMKIDIC